MTTRKSTPKPKPPKAATDNYSVRTKEVPLKRFAFVMYFELDEDMIWENGMPSNAESSELEYSARAEALKHMKIMDAWNLESESFDVVEIAQRGELKSGLDVFYTLNKKKA